MTKADYIMRVHRQYGWISMGDLDEVYEIAKRELFITLYSYNTSIIDDKTTIPYIYEYKVLEAMKEIIDIGNLRSFTSYQENGWSWTRPKNGLSSYINIKSYAGAK